MMGLPISAYIAAACLLAVASCEPPVFQDVTLPCHKLTAKTVTPTKYEVDLSFNSLDSAFYEGQVNISLELRTADRDRSHPLEKICTMRGALDEIVLHADESLEIHDIRLTQEKRRFLKAKLKESEINKVFRDRGKQMIKIKLEREPNANTEAKLSIWFRGRMRKDKRGIYVSHYNNGTQVFKHIVAQFQPTFARTAFPCFDEPRFRVPFKLTLHHPKGLTAYSNTDVRYEHKGTALATTKFEKTPPIPLHMVAFTVGQFDKPLKTVLRPPVDYRPRTKPVKVRVITAPGQSYARYYAFIMATQSLEWFERYIDYPFPMGKLDIIAIADLDKDNAESWGLAFIRDTNLLIDNEHKDETLIPTAVNVAHVVVHQWFGNLISVSKWQDIWITESVAAQMALRFLATLGKDWPKLWHSEFLVRLGVLSLEMQADQSGKMHALSPPEEDLLTSSQIYGIFDTLEFMKSASLAQMLSESLGESKYKEWLRQLVAENANKTISRESYMEKIPRKSVGAISSFVDYSGLPLVNVDVSGDSLHFSVEPYNTADETFGPGSSLQPITIFTNARFVKHNEERTEACYINGPYEKNFIPSPLWFQESTTKDRAFFKLSLRPSISAFFRTRYSDDLLQMLVNAVRQKWLEPMDRIQLLDDANNLVQDKLMKRESFANLVAAYTNETHSGVLIQLLAVNKTLASLGLESPLGRTFMNVFEALGFEVSGMESVLEQRARQDILKALVAQQEETVVKAALNDFNFRYVAHFLREPVYAAVVQAGDKEQVELLFKLLHETQIYEEKIRLVTALAGSKDKEVLTSLREWLKSSGLKAETIRPFEDQIAATLLN